MEILHLQRTQKKLRNPAQLSEMICAIEEGLSLPPIRLAEFEDGTIQIEDGHHRCLAYWLAGQDRLELGQYVLIQKENSRRPNYGPIWMIDA